jgi:hypothetical protein
MALAEILYRSNPIIFADTWKRQRRVVYWAPSVILSHPCLPSFCGSSTTKIDDLFLPSFLSFPATTTALHRRHLPQGRRRRQEPRGHLRLRQVAQGQKDRLRWRVRQNPSAFSGLSPPSLSLTILPSFRSTSSPSTTVSPRTTTRRASYFLTFLRSPRLCFRH